MSWKSSIFYYSLQCCLQIVVHQINACDYQSRPTHCLAESPKLYTESAKCPGFSNRLVSVPDSLCQPHQSCQRLDSPLIHLSTHLCHHHHCRHPLLHHSHSRLKTYLFSKTFRPQYTFGNSVDCITYIHTYIHTYITICIARCVDSTEYTSNQIIHGLLDWTGLIRLIVCFFMLFFSSMFGLIRMVCVFVSC